MGTPLALVAAPARVRYPLPAFPPGPRSPATLRAYLLSLADTAAREAGLADAGSILTMALQAQSLHRPWRGVDYELASAAAALRDIAERPVVLAVPVAA